MFKQIILFLLSFIILFLTKNEVKSQEIEFKNSSIKTGVGIGINEGKRETGIGLIYSIGWQKSYGEKKKLRLNPNIILGSFRPFVIPTDTRDQFYKLSTLGLNLHYDLIKYKAVSIVTSAGGFFNYSRGLLGTGGWQEANSDRSEYFHSLYFGGTASLALRVDPGRSKLAYEFRPINISIGNSGYFLYYVMFGIDFKLMEN